MRPLSLASYDVMLRTGNPLVNGDLPAEGTPEFTAALMGFVYAHCAPWPEVVRASFDEQAFREAALIFCGGLTPADFQTAFKRLEEQIRELEAAQVEPVSGLAGKRPAVRRTRLPSRPGVRRRRRDRLARGVGHVHAVGAVGATPALPGEEEWRDDELEQIGRRRVHAAGTVGGAPRKLGRQRASRLIVSKLAPSGSVLVETD